MTNDPRDPVLSSTAGPTTLQPPNQEWPAVSAPSRRRGGLVTALTILLLGAAAVSAYAGVTFLDRASLLGDGVPSISKLIEADENAVNAILAVFLVQLVTGVVWMVWQYRHARQAARLGHRHGLGPGWAIGGWLIPVGNLFLPYRQLLDSAKPSAGGAPSVLYGWWAAMVLSAVLIVSGFRTHGSDVRAADQMRGLGYLVLAVAGLLAIVVVRACSHRQQEAIRAGGQS